MFASNLAWVLWLAKKYSPIEQVALLKAGVWSLKLCPTPTPFPMFPEAPEWEEGSMDLLKLSGYSLKPRCQVMAVLLALAASLPGVLRSVT